MQCPGNGIVPPGARHCIVHDRVHPVMHDGMVGAGIPCRYTDCPRPRPCVAAAAGGQGAVSPLPVC